MFSSTVQLHTIDLSSPYLNKPFWSISSNSDWAIFQMNAGNASVGGATAKHTYIHILQEVTVKTHKTKKNEREKTDYKLYLIKIIMIHLHTRTLLQKIRTSMRWPFKLCKTNKWGGKDESNKILYYKNISQTTRSRNCNNHLKQLPNGLCILKRWA